MEYRDGRFAVRINGNRFVFHGMIDRAEYGALTKFLMETERSIVNEELEFDFRYLEYMNSLGICELAVLFIKCEKKVRVLINPEVTWQRVGLVPLRELKKDDGIMVEEIKG